MKKKDAFLRMLYIVSKSANGKCLAQNFSLQDENSSLPIQPPHTCVYTAVTLQYIYWQNAKNSF